MSLGLIIISFLAGATIVFIGWWFVHKAKLAQYAANIDASKAAEIATLLEKLRSIEDQNRDLKNLSDQFTIAFKALSHDALKSNNESFIELARANFDKLQQGASGELEKRTTAFDELVKPIKESLTKVDTKLEELERLRIHSHTSLVEQLKNLNDSSNLLRSETDKLVNALRRPSARGRWGEIQLRRVVELTGMLNYCDFYEQENIEVEGKMLRPDMIIKLPSNRNVIVDSKVPLEAFLKAIESKNEDEKVGFLKDHARQIKQLVIQLSQKSYWEHVKPAPEFVVLFMPGESFFGAALEYDPELIEFAASKNVILATPTTLIALLRTVAYGWRQDAMAANAEVISKLGKELHDRLRTFLNHFGKIKKGIDLSANAYNDAVNSLESRVLVSARKFKELGIDGQHELENPGTVDSATKTTDVIVVNE